MKNYSPEIAQVIMEHLEEHNMQLVAYDERGGSIGFVMRLLGQISFIHYIIHVHENSYTVVAICPVSPNIGDSAVLSAMAEFIARANYGLKNGNFEIDFRDGEIRYKCFVDCENQIPSQSIIHNSIAIPAAMMKRYARGIINVLYKEMDAETAVEDCEQQKNLLCELEEAKCALEHLLKKRHTSKENNPNQSDMPEETENSDDFSFDDILRMMGCSKEEIADTIATSSSSASDDNADSESEVALRLINALDEIGDDDIDIGIC